MSERGSGESRGFGAWLADFAPRYGPAITKRERWGIRILGVALGLLGPVAFIQGRGLTVIMLVASAGALLLLPGRIGHLANAMRAPLPAALIVACVWICVSMAWSPLGDPRWLLDAIGPILLGLVLVAAAGDIDAHYRRTLLLVFSASLTLLILLVAIEAATQGALTGILRGGAEVQTAVYSRGGGFAVMFIFPFLLAAWRVGFGRLLLPVLFALVVFAVFGLSMRAAMAALVAGVLALAIGWWRPRTALIATGGLVALYALAAPWLSFHLLTIDGLQAAGIDLPTSWWHRVAIWNFAATKIQEAPLFGWGFNASRWFGTLGFTVALPGLGEDMVNIVPIHTHNAILQIWLEFGLAGVLIFLAIWGAMLRILWARMDDRNWIASALAAITALSVFFLVSFSLWRFWWLSVLFLAALLMTWLYRLERR